MMMMMSFVRCAKRSMPPSRSLWQLKYKLSCLQCVGVDAYVSRPDPACLQFPLFQPRLFICVCMNNMALRQRKIFRLDIINYIVVRARSRRRCGRQRLGAEQSYFGFASRKECEGSDTEIMSLKAISACQKIFFKRRRQRDNKLTAFAFSFLFFWVL